MMKMKNGNQYKTQKRQDDGWGGGEGGNNAYKNYMSQVENNTE